MPKLQIRNKYWLEQAVRHKQISDIDRVIRLNELKAKTGLSKSAIYRGIDEGTFPPAFRIGKRAVGWRLSAINAWLDAAEQKSFPEGVNA